MKAMVGLMYRMDVVSSGKPMTVACDGRRSKAWGICARPKEQLGTDEDDIALLEDDELGDAPADPGEYEGGCAKPSGPHAMNKWCSRQCERSVKVARGEAITLPDFSKRLLNQPWKHQEEVR